MEIMEVGVSSRGYVSVAPFGVVLVDGGNLAKALKGTPDPSSHGIETSIE